MSGSMKLFIVWASLILVLIVVLGCLPNKQGGFTCIAAPLLSKIQSLIPAAKKTANQVQAPPSDIKVEEAKINKVIGSVCTAFKAKDIEGALKYFAEDERDTYRKALSQSPDVLPAMAADLEKAKINSLSFDSDESDRTAEYLVKSGGQTASIVFINTGGQWLLKAF
jgi:hypothetical protein